MRLVCAASLAAVLMTLPLGAQVAAAAGAQEPQSQAPGTSTPQAPGTNAPANPAPQAPGGPAPQVPPGQVPGAVAPAVPVTPPVVARTFAAPAGLLFNTVRADRVADFEKVMGYLRAALESSPDATVRAQARGWRVFKATEPGPAGSVLYVYVIDPTVPGADYGLGPILAEAYPDPTQLQEIWRLYTGSVTGGGSLLNLTPLQTVLPTPPGLPSMLGPGTTATPPGTIPPAPVPVVPPDSDPNRRP